MNKRNTYFKKDVEVQCHKAYVVEKKGVLQFDWFPVLHEMWSNPHNEEVGESEQYCGVIGLHQEPVGYTWICMQYNIFEIIFGFVVIFKIL